MRWVSEDVSSNFFVIDSDNAVNIESKLYGFAFLGNEAVFDDSSLSGLDSGNSGCYVYVQRDGDIIQIKQDYISSCGIHLYRSGEYFALSNSLLYLVDYLKEKRGLTLNRQYAEYLLMEGLCSTSHSETMVDEIVLLDRRAQVIIDVQKRELRVKYVDYCENEIDVATQEGMRLLDDWFDRWSAIVAKLAWRERTSICLPI